jgi:SAM-dependent methyltransferase
MDIDGRLREFASVWENKPVLRTIYSHYYQLILQECRPGPTLEIGGGVGNLKRFAGDILTVDILPAPWLDVVCDAQQLPFAQASFENIVMFDVLHHLANPSDFFREAERILRSGGKLVVLEPAITPVSWMFYNFIHHEAVDMSQDPFQRVASSVKDPYESNQAIPTLLFLKYQQRFHAIFPNLRVTKTELLSLFAYPLSGGFKKWSLIPQRLVSPMLRLEDRLNPLLGRLLAFRLLAIVTRT